jgi:hypothetical protein
VLAAELVTADGELRTVTADSDPELFWAIRGGKGNLGIVTALEFRLYAVPALVGGGYFFAGRDAAAVLHAFRAWAPTLPEEASTSVAVLRLPPLEELPPPLRGRTVVHLRFLYAGDDPQAGAALVAPMTAAGEVLLGGVGPMPPTALDAVHMDPTDPMPGWEKGVLLADLTAETVDALLAAAGPRTSRCRWRWSRSASSAARWAGRRRCRRRGRALAALVGVRDRPDGAGPDRGGAAGRPRACSPRCAVGAPGALVNFLGDVSGPGRGAGAWDRGGAGAAARRQARRGPRRRLLRRGTPSGLRCLSARAAAAPLAAPALGDPHRPCRRRAGHRPGAAAGTR